VSQLRLAPIAACLFLGVFGAPAVAQSMTELPDISREFLNLQNRLEGDTIRFCVYGASAIGEYDRAVAQLLGDALLLEVEIHEVEPPIAVEGLDTIPISLEDLFILLTNDCDGFLGIELAPDVYPEWLTFTRAYFTAPYVVAVREGSFESFAQLPPGAPIATQSLSTGDIQFGAFNTNLPEAERLSRRPYPHTILQLERLRDETVDAAVVWRPWLERNEADMAGLATLPATQLALPSRPMGIALRSRDTYLRTSLDQAIAQLEADGLLDQLYGELYRPVGTQP